MRHLLVALLAGSAALSACQTTPAGEAVPMTPMPAPPPADASAIPAGTHLDVQLQNELSTSTTRVGDVFTVTVREPLVATNGQIVVPQGAVITGMVTGVGERSGASPAALRLNFVRIAVDGVTHPLTAEIVGTHVPMEEHRDHAVTRDAAVGAVTGAVLGAVIGGDLRNILIGAALGAGAGTIISLGMGGDTEAVLPAGTHMTLRTADRVLLR
ncbi:hypothetical protein BH23GEM9_BH23GEM9_21760 [soil metagenome]